MSLSKLCSDILAKAAVDHDSPEIQDITSALEELLNRLFRDEITVNYSNWQPLKSFHATLKFRCSSILPCGSMAEKTSLWKYTRRQGGERKYIEYDNLVLLDDVENVIRIKPGYGNCQGCRELYIGDHVVSAYVFVCSFLDTIYSRIDIMCSCHAEPNDTCSDNDSRDSRPCDYCRVDRGTGYLHIAKVADFNRWNVKYNEHCSLVVYWTSHTGSLMAPNINTLELTEIIKRLVIRVDILPAFVIPDNRDDDESGLQRFVIPKTCPSCGVGSERLMVSYCRYEWKAIHTDASSMHKQAYSMLKFLYGQSSFWTETDEYIKSYHAKIAFITHCETCTDDGEDCTRCVTDILQSLKKAYTSDFLNLPKFHGLRSLMLGHQFDNKSIYKLYILSMISVVSQLKNLAEDKQCNSQYRLRPVVDLIKRTCLALLDGKLDMQETHGKNLIHTVQPYVKVDRIPFFIRIASTKLLKKVCIIYFCFAFVTSQSTIFQSCWDGANASIGLTNTLGS